MDIRLAKLAETYGCDYSRYADDLTFSTNKPSFPPAIARATKSAPHTWQPGKELKDIIKRSGFALNAAKTRMQYHESRQEVTGLVVNSKVNVRAEYQRTARAMAHQLFKTGVFIRTCYVPDPSGTIIQMQIPGTLNQLQGIFGFINNVKKSNWNQSQPAPEKRVGYERTYRDLLFYKKFFAADMPVLLCEGKTDNIYIKCALRRLVATTKLAVKKSGKVSFKVKFMSYTDTTARIMDLAGGTGDFHRLIGTYRNEWKKFSIGHLKQPVILLIDNDKGADSLFGLISKVTKKPVTRKEQFIHIFHNLYVVPTPRTASGKDTMIEDFFHKSVRQQKLGTKTFNPSQTAESKTEFGKYIFAEKIVRLQQSTIDFSKFAPILKGIEKAIEDYASKS